MTRRAAIDAQINAILPMAGGANLTNAQHNGLVKEIANYIDSIEPEVMDLRDFDIDPTGNNDSSIAMLEARQEAIDRNESVIMKLPKGVVVMDNAPDPLEGNAQFPIPYNAQSSATLPNIKLIGVTEPCMNLGMGGGFTQPNTGSILLSTHRGSGALIGSKGNPLNYNLTATHFSIENVTLRTDAGTLASKYSNNSKALDARAFNFLTVNNVRIDTTLAPFDMLQPGAGSAGLLLPLENNGGWVVVDRLGVSGYTKAVANVDEHASLNNINIHGCTRGLEFVSLSGNYHHPSNVGRIHCNGVRYCLFFDGNHITYIAQYSTEHANQNQWYEFYADVYEQSGLSLVDIAQATTSESYAAGPNNGLWREVSYADPDTTDINDPAQIAVKTFGGALDPARFSIKQRGA